MTTLAAFGWFLVLLLFGEVVKVEGPYDAKTCTFLLALKNLEADQKAAAQGPTPLIYKGQTVTRKDLKIRCDRLLEG